jgi:hypothetical protein
MFMGRPTAMFSNDVFFGSCLVGYGVVNLLPYDLGYRILSTFLGSLLIVVLSQVFRVGGIYGYSDAAHQNFRASPSAYYPTPVFGPILFPSVLGNMGGFLWGGFDGYLEGGMPWLFQQGVSCSAFYHFYAHDETGWIGVNLRGMLRPAAMRIMVAMGADDRAAGDDVLFARFAVGAFMVLMSVLHMPQLLGPKFSPFAAAYDAVAWTLGAGRTASFAGPPPPHPSNGSSGCGNAHKKSKKKKTQ